MTELDALTQVVTSIMELAEPRPQSGSVLDTIVWEGLRQSGLDTLLVPVEVGGSGGSFADLAVILRSAGVHGVRVPISEASLATAVLARCRVPLPDGLTTLDVTRTPSGADAREVIASARAADVVLVVSPAAGGRAEIRLGRLTDATIEPGTNLAGEPRDRVYFPDGTLSEVGTLPSLWQIQLEAAACRALLCTGALERVRDLTISYAREREQFGRPIGRFQAVQALVVQAITATQAARAMTDYMVNALDSGHDTADLAPVVAAARSVTGRGAAVVSAAAHQVHGAMGFTTEHSLHAFTTRLLAWRDEDGSDVWWSNWLGSHLMAHDRGHLWDLVTSTATARNTNGGESDLRPNGER